MVLTKENHVFFENLINIFTADKGELKVLLIRKKHEPYKGYWVLPGAYLNKNETIENSVTDAVLDKTGLLNVYIEQGYTFSALDRDPSGRTIALSFIGLIDSKSAEIKKEDRPDVESEWFTLDNLPKLGYDHEIIIHKSMDFLKKKIISSTVLKSLFPSDFTLPELQKIYEQILGKKLDRRNFRKKFVGLNLIEDTLEINIGFNGRPAKLYRFKNDIQEIDLF